mmetsp:Transcript_122663/g.381231  ORF Transcript_122663/g.381231 Transcript_122663/m.381231 type:complete len:348 (+) Transcript_122663:336-1379(+)
MVSLPSPSSENSSGLGGIGKLVSRRDPTAFPRCTAGVAGCFLPGGSGTLLSGSTQSSGGTACLFRLLGCTPWTLAELGELEGAPPKRASQASVAAAASPPLQASTLPVPAGSCRASLPLLASTLPVPAGSSLAGPPLLASTLPAPAGSSRDAPACTCMGFAFKDRTPEPGPGCATATGRRRKAPGRRVVFFWGASQMSRKSGQSPASGTAKLASAGRLHVAMALSTQPGWTTKSLPDSPSARRCIATWYFSVSRRAVTTCVVRGPSFCSTSAPNARNHHGTACLSKSTLPATIPLRQTTQPCNTEARRAWTALGTLGVLSSAPSSLSGGSSKAALWILRRVSCTISS